RTAWRLPALFRRSRRSPAPFGPVVSSHPRIFDVCAECGCGSGQQLDGAAHTLAVTAPNAVRCCRTKFRKVSGGRPLAAARAEGSVSIRAIVGLSSIILARVGGWWV